MVKIARLYYVHEVRQQDITEMLGIHQSTVSRLLKKAREANVVRLYFLERSTAEAIAGIYKVSRRTIHRWLEDVRARIKAETRRVLAEKFKVSESEFSSVLNMVESQLDLSIHGALKQDR